MKTTWTMTLAATAAIALLASKAEAQAQGWPPGVRQPAFGPNQGFPGAPQPFAPPPLFPGLPPAVDRKRDRDDRGHFGSPAQWMHLAAHGWSGSTPPSRPPGSVPIKPTVPVPPEGFVSPVSSFKVPTIVPEISPTHFSAPRTGWFSSATGRGVGWGIGGGILAALGGLFGRKKNDNA